jgi:hypothetical protein
MNRIWCERELDVVEALRKGHFSDELRGHVGSCTICAETQPVAEVLLKTASRLQAEHEPLAAGLIWRRAQAQKKEIALKRAARPLIFMRVMSVAYAVLSVAWLLRTFWRFGSIGRISNWNVLPMETVAGVAVAVLAIAIGAWYLLHDSGRSGEGIPLT